jgi:GTP-binding protein HflX
MQVIDPKAARAIVAAVQLPNVSDAEFDASLTELRQLAKTLGFQVVGRFTQKRAGFDSAAYFGSGKREELRELVHNESGRPTWSSSTTRSRLRRPSRSRRSSAAR